MTSPGSAIFDRSKVKLGVTPTLWWNDDFPLIDMGVTFEQCVSEMALAGFEGCSVGHKYPKDPATLVAALAAARVESLRTVDEHVFHHPSTWGRGHAQGVRRSTLASSSRHWVAPRWSSPNWAAPCIRSRSPSLPMRPTFTDAQWAALCRHEQDRRHRRSRRHAALYHHHMGTGVMTRAETDRLWRHRPRVRPPLLDTGHVAFAGGRPLEMAKAYATPDRTRPSEKRPPRGGQPGQGARTCPSRTPSRPASSPFLATARSTSCPSCRPWPTTAMRAGWWSRPNRTRSRRIR